MILNYNECQKAAVNPEAVNQIGLKLEKIAAEAKALGLCIFFGDSGVSLRFEDEAASYGALIVAHVLIVNSDAGEGDTNHHYDGFERGGI